MGVFTFVCRQAGGEWTAKEFDGDLEASAASSSDLQKKLIQSALSRDSAGGLQTSFSVITPTSAVFQVIVGGGSSGGYVSGGGAAAAAPAGAAAEAAPAAEEKKEEKEESDDDMGFSLFD